VAGSSEYLQNAVLECLGPAEALRRQVRSRDSGFLVPSHHLGSRLVMLSLAEPSGLSLLSWGCSGSEQCDLLQLLVAGAITGLGKKGGKILWLEGSS